MNTSLEQHLTRLLTLTFIMVGCLATGLAFYLVYNEAQAYQDADLRQMAVLSSHYSFNHKSAVSVSAQLKNFDPEMGIKIFALSPQLKSSWLPADLSAGYHTINSEEGNWRVYVIKEGISDGIAAAQPTDAMDEIALHSTLVTLLPLLVLLPILLWLAVRIVRRGFAPLRALALALETHMSEQPSLLPEADLPKEIAPFVQAINRQTLRIQRYIIQQQRFIADASHELRTPLAALSLQAQNLEQADNCNDMRSRLVPLRAGIERAHQLTAQLLSLSRNQSGVPNFVKLAMSSWLRDVIVQYLPIAEAKSVDLGLEDPGHVLLFTDPDVLATVVRNGLDNALRYTPTGGQVTLKVSRLQEMCLLEIIDTGPGIPESKLERVFTPFYRLDATHEGSGLGLAIAREAATRLGGTLRLRKAGKQGLVFCYQQAC